MEDVWDLERRVCQPLRHPIGPVLHADQPWESGVRYCHVFYDERDETYRRAAFFLASRAREGGLRSVLVSSATRGEGTTTTTLHVADELIRSTGLNPLIIELDVEQPVYIERFGLDPEIYPSSEKSASRLMTWFSMLCSQSSSECNWRIVTPGDDF